MALALSCIFTHLFCSLCCCMFLLLLLCFIFIYVNNNAINILNVNFFVIILAFYAFCLRKQAVWKRNDVTGIKNF